MVYLKDHHIYLLLKAKSQVARQQKSQMRRSNVNLFFETNVPKFINY